MTRSYRKTPIRGMTCAKSEKEYKVMLNQIMRRINKTRIKTGFDNPFVVKNDVFTKWDMPKDGKIYCKDPKVRRK